MPDGFAPKGAEEPLPDEPAFVEYTDADRQDILDGWDATMRDLPAKGMLAAIVYNL